MRWMRKFGVLAVLTATTALAQIDRGESSADRLGLKVWDISDSISFGHNKGCRTRDSVDVLVIHSNFHVGQSPYDMHGCIEQFQAYNVSPHYLITREGDIVRMVKEHDVAWHAGRSSMPVPYQSPYGHGTSASSHGTILGLNNSSIGIEIINTMLKGPNMFQYKALLLLCQRLVEEWGIRYVVRHSDIAPGRKTDPWLLDWDRFEQDLTRLSGRDDLLFPRATYGIQ